MRKKLDKLYLYSGYLSAFFMMLIALTIVAQILGRFVNITIDSTETAGFSLGSTYIFWAVLYFSSWRTYKSYIIYKIIRKKNKEISRTVLSIILYCNNCLSYLLVLGLCLFFLYL